LDGESMSTAFLLSGLGRIVREEIEGELRTVGLSLRHLSALGHLSRTPGLSYSELGRRAGITAQSMQATLRQLEALGAVERVTLAGRGRTAELHLTDSGGAMLARGRDAVRKVDDSLLGDLPPHERTELTGLLLRAFTIVAARGGP
jgi:DNA-binding MarR family transcriptional regulator